MEEIKMELDKMFGNMLRIYAKKILDATKELSVFYESIEDRFEVYFSEHEEDKLDEALESLMKDIMNELIETGDYD